ncbi:hypothetical protein GF327_06425 [Candidatus Woesearchaeota archaeon]|nr:hypothetical protein [Candidatus Woesearchaeota archaeon]
MKNAIQDKIIVKHVLHVKNVSVDKKEVHLKKICVNIVIHVKSVIQDKIIIVTLVMFVKSVIQDKIIVKHVLHVNHVMFVKIV